MPTPAEHRPSLPGGSVPTAADPPHFSARWRCRRRGIR